MKPLCEPSSGFVGIKSPSDSEKVPLICRAKYRLAGTLVLWLEWRKNTESILTQKGHLPFSQSAWCFDVCSCRLFFPNTPSQNTEANPPSLTLASPEGAVVAHLCSRPFPLFCLQFARACETWRERTGFQGCGGAGGTAAGSSPTPWGGWWP